MKYQKQTMDSQHLFYFASSLRIPTEQNTIKQNNKVGKQEISQPQINWD